MTWLAMVQFIHYEVGIGAVYHYNACNNIPSASFTVPTSYFFHSSLRCTMDIINNAVHRCSTKHEYCTTSVHLPSFMESKN
jgi:hypothetical protein